MCVVVQDFGISKVANFVNRNGANNPELTLRNNQTVFNELTSFAGTWRWNGTLDSTSTRLALP